MYIYSAIPPKIRSSIHLKPLSCTEASAAQRGLQEELSEAEKALARAEVEKVGKPMEAQRGWWTQKHQSV